MRRQLRRREEFTVLLSPRASASAGLSANVDWRITRLLPGANALILLAVAAGRTE
jgi:hypothetical protein